MPLVLLACVITGSVLVAWHVSDRCTIFTTPSIPAALSPITISQQQQQQQQRCNKHPENSTAAEAAALLPRGPRQHVYYLKTHKTGSTTMYSIFAEYCRSHDLLPLLPRGVHINQAPPVGKQQLLLAREVLKYDMVFNHHVYSPYLIDSFMHEDTFKVTTLREPFKQFISSFTYFSDSGEFEYLNAIPGPDPILEFLKHPHKYEAKGYSSYTNNRQSMDLGYDIRHSFDDIGYISQFIKLTERRFDLIMITDYFKESLIMLKRALLWKTQDILYFSKNKSSKTPKIEIEVGNKTMIKELHARISKADTMLYAHFLSRFKERMSGEIGLDEEVSEFEDVLEKVKAYCNDIRPFKDSLLIPKRKWTDSVYLLPYKCKWLRLDEVKFTQFLQKRQKTVLS